MSSVDPDKKGMNVGDKVIIHKSGGDRPATIVSISSTTTLSSLSTSTAASSGNSVLVDHDQVDPITGEDIVLVDY